MYKNIYKDKWRASLTSKCFYEVLSIPNNLEFYSNINSSTETIISKARTGCIFTEQYLHSFNLNGYPLSKKYNNKMETMGHILLECTVKLL